jgi:hypothetical protein
MCRSVSKTTMTELNPDKPLKPIAEFAARPDFPDCARGEFVDIGGYTGVVIDIAHNSMHVKSPEGVTRRFNFHTLRKLYGPPPEEPAPIPPPQAADKPPETVTATEPQEIEDPNFDQEIRSISQFVSRADFPQCTLGQFVDIRGYGGVVVRIADHSLLVRSRDGTSRRYNADVLRKLHGQK